MKRIFKIFVLVFVLSVQSFAFVGGSDPYSYLNYLENQKTQINTLKQLEQKIKEIEMMTQQMKSIPGKLAGEQIRILQDNIKEMSEIQNSAKSIMKDYRDYQNQFNQIYKDFKDLKNMKSEDYIRYMDKMANELNNSIYDAMKSQGMIVQLGNDSANLSRLASQVYTAEGQQQVLQTMANISAVNGQQLIRMQKMMADTNKVQMQYLEQKVQEERLAKEKTKNIYNKSQKWDKNK